MKQSLATRRRRYIAKGRKMSAPRISYPLNRPFYLNDVELTLLYSSGRSADLIAANLGRRRGSMDYMIMDLLVRGALISTEICRLEKEHIDFDGNIIRYRRKGVLRRREFDPELIEHIRDYCEQFEIERGHVIIYGGKPLSASSIRKCWDRCLKRAGLSKSFLIAARHTVGVNVYFQTGNLRKAALAAGVSLYFAKCAYRDVKRSDFEENYHLTRKKTVFS